MKEKEAHTRRKVCMWNKWVLCVLYEQLSNINGISPLIICYSHQPVFDLMENHIQSTFYAFCVRCDALCASLICFSVVLSTIKLFSFDISTCESSTHMPWWIWMRFFSCFTRQSWKPICHLCIVAFCIIHSLLKVWYEFATNLIYNNLKHIIMTDY